MATISVRRRLRGIAAAALVGAGAVVLLFDAPDANPPVAPAESEPASSQPAAAQTAAARAALEQLPVKGRAPLTGYTREAFGPAWSDIDGNGCDTRNDVLRRDLLEPAGQGCEVWTGTLIDPYSGARIAFERGPQTSMDVQVDHVVSLANAWQTGAQYWPAGRRERFANDPRNLLAVRGDLNLQKRDGDAATWLPPRKAFRCEFVSIQILTKKRHGLWLTPAEKAAMQRVLDRC